MTQTTMNNTGFKLPVHTNSTLCPVIVAGLGAPKSDPRPKNSPDGRQTYASNTILMTLRNDGTVQPDKTASVHVIERADDYPIGTMFRAEGDIWVQPYQSGSGDSSRVSMSITVERLVPIRPAAQESTK